MKFIRVIKANKIEKLIESVKYGFFDEPELTIDFLNKMNISTKGLYNEKGRIDEAVYDRLIEKAIRKNPEKAVENLGSLGEEIWYEDKEVKSAKNEQIKFKFPVVTNVQEVEELLQEYDLTYKFRDNNSPYPSLVVIGDKDEIIRFAKEVMTGDWENDEDAKEFVSKFIPELKKLKSNNKVQKLIDSAIEGLLDDNDLAIEFLKNMGISSKGLLDEYGKLNEQKCANRIEKVIRQNPEKAAQELGMLGDIYFE